VATVNIFSTVDHIKSPSLSEYFSAVSLNGRVALHDLLHSVIPMYTASLVCLYACIRGHYEHLHQGHACDNFSVLSLWILKEGCCYCVKYVRFLLFLILCLFTYFAR